MSSPELTVRYLNSASALPLSVYSAENGKCVASSGALEGAGHYIVKPILKIPGAVHYRVTDEWLIAGYVKDAENDLIYVLGPAFITAMDKFAPQKYLREMGLSIQNVAEYVPYLEHLPQVNELKFKQYLMLLHYIVLGTEPAEEHLIDAVIKDRQELQLKTDVEKSPDNAPHNYELEMQTLQYIEKGDLAGMKSFIRRKFSSGGELRKTADDFLRSSKNTFIKTATLACRAAIKGGVDYAIATGIADNYVFRAERLTSARDVFSLNSDMMLHFTELTHAYKKLDSKSKLVHDVFNYINANIYQKISLNDISDALKLSAPYISRKFKDETGVALNEYITQLKLEKAKYLLLSSDMSISSVAYSLGFSSQNYFHKVFKENVGKTPAEFKATNSLDD